jgi:hypothetical protein
MATMLFYIIELKLAQEISFHSSKMYYYKSFQGPKVSSINVT